MHTPIRRVMTIAVPMMSFLLLSVAAQSSRAQGASTQRGGLTKNAGTLLVANKRGDSLSRIDLASGAETHRVATCSNPHELAVSPDRTHVVLACYDGTALEILRIAGLEPVKRIELGSNARPHGVVWHAGDKIVASAEGRGSIFVVEAPLSDHPAVREIGAGDTGPHLVVIDAAGKVAWGTLIDCGTVVRYDLVAGRETARRRLGGETEAIALSPDDSSLWVGSNATNKVYRLDPDTLAVQLEVATGAVPIRLAAHPAGGWIISSNFGEGTLSVIHASSGNVARTLPISGSAGVQQVTLVFSGDGSRLYAAETAMNTIAEIDFESGKVLRRLAVGEGGDGLAVFD